MDDLEIEIGEVDGGVVDIAVLEWVHRHRAERHRLVNGDDLHTAFPTVLQDRI